MCVPREVANDGVAHVRSERELLGRARAEERRDNPCALLTERLRLRGARRRDDTRGHRRAHARAVLGVGAHERVRGRG